MMSRRRRMLKDLDQDIRDHIASETQENIERGMSTDEARSSGPAQIRQRNQSHRRDTGSVELPLVRAVLR